MSPVAASVHKALSFVPVQTRTSGDIGAVARGSSTPSAALAVTTGNAIDPPTHGGKIPKPQGCSSSCSGGNEGSRETAGGPASNDVFSAIEALLQKFNEAQAIAERATLRK